MIGIYDLCVYEESCLEYYKLEEHIIVIIYCFGKCLSPSWMVIDVQP